LQDAPRPGVRPKFTAEHRSQMAALACEAPAKAGRPISQWTGREIAEELKARGTSEQPNVRIVYFENTGHLIRHVVFEQYMASVRAFLKEY
jgi:hypothetical protein